jgi:outer membrane protein assembly factor BamB
MTVRGISLLTLGIACLLLASGADWPQWRGPERNGISQEKGLLQEWPEAGPKLLWRIEDIGEGYSTPAVVGDRLYLLSNRGEDDEFVLALSAKDGAEVWSTRIGRVGNPEQSPPYPGTRSTPTVDGDVLYALGSDGDLVCLEIASGKVRWAKNLRTDFGGKYGEWAYSESPLVDGDVLVCTPGGEEATIVALNKKSGELIWKCAFPGGSEAAYASVIKADLAGVTQYVQFLGEALVGVNAESGELLWQYEKTAEGSPANIPTPVARGDHVYSATGRAGAGLVKITKNGDKFEAEEVYFTSKMPTSIGGAVLIGDYLYGTTGRAQLCAEFLTADIQWEAGGIGAGALCFADNRIYIHGENGDVSLIEPTPEAYREKGRFTPPGQPDRGRAKAWTYPVVSNGRLYIRDQDVVWCYDVQAKSAE